MRTQCGMEILWPYFQPFWALSHAKFAKWQPTGHIWPLDMLNLACAVFLKSYHWKCGELFFFLICIFGFSCSRFVFPDGKNWQEWSNSHRLGWGTRDMVSASTQVRGVWGASSWAPSIPFLLLCQPVCWISHFFPNQFLSILLKVSYWRRTKWLELGRFILDPLCI